MRAAVSADPVVVLGVWHLGAVTAAALAHLGYQVTGVEAHASRLRALAAGEPPLYEPGLGELFDEEIASGRLGFVDDPIEAVAGAKFVMFAEDVPVNDHDEPDISGLIGTVRAVAPHLAPGATLIVQSQVPVGTCALILQAVQDANPAGEVHLAYCPENLRLGEAIERFLRPDMIVIGVDTPEAQSRAEELFRPIEAPRVVMDVRSAEMTKHALNALLATAVSFGNEIGALCELVGADALHVVRALRLDRRVGPGLPLNPGPPFTGGTLARDISVLRRLAKTHGVRVPLLEGVMTVNETQKTWALQRLEETLGTLRNAQIAILGMTYKAGTSTIRRSLAVELIQSLKGRGVSVTAYDPRVDLTEVDTLPSFTRVADPYEAAHDADALVIMTDWPEFRALDLKVLRHAMRGNVLIDTWNLFDSRRASSAGFAYFGVGRRS